MCDSPRQVAGCDRRASAAVVDRRSSATTCRWKVERGIAEAGSTSASSLEHALFGDAILTTDTRRKSAAVEFKLGRQPRRLAGVTKGSGMIGPRRLAGPAWRPPPRTESTHRQRRSRRHEDRRGKPAARGAQSGQTPTHATMLAYLTTDARFP
jgi:N-acetylglutamate synthase/N-acetylornithine aminotransferase